MSVTDTAVLPVDEDTVQFVSALLAADRRRRRIRPKRRALGCYRQAVLVLRWFLDGTRLTQLAADNAIGRSTAYRYLHEGIDVLAGRAPGLRGALLAARAAGHSHVTVDGTLIRTDRCHVPGPTACTDRSGRQVDLWWSGKHAAHGGNVQVIAAPTAGHCGPRRFGPAANSTPPPCAPSPRPCRCWRSGPMRRTPPWPRWRSAACGD